MRVQPSRCLTEQFWKASELNKGSVLGQSKNYYAGIALALFLVAGSSGNSLDQLPGAAAPSTNGLRQSSGCDGDLRPTSGLCKRDNGNEQS